MFCSFKNKKDEDKLNLILFGKSVIKCHNVSEHSMGLIKHRQNSEFGEVCGR